MKRLMGFLLFLLGAAMVLNETFSMQPDYVVLAAGLASAVAGVIGAMDPVEPVR